MNQVEIIKLEQNPETGACELKGVEGEIDVSDRIVNAVALDRKLIEFVALHIAHNRAEQSSTENGQAIGQLVAHEIEIVNSELRQRLQSGI